MRIFLVIFLFSLTSSLLAQNKVEREYDLNPDDVPKAAYDRINQLAIQKINWIYEESESTHSIEAKFKFNREWYSIEFDTLGNFQDAEIELDWKEVNESLRSTIEKSLDRKTENFKIRKVQKQLKGETNQVLNDMLNQKLRNRWISGYELVVNAKVDGVYHQYEFFYDPKGQMQRMQQIELRGTDNLEF